MAQRQENQRVLTSYWAVEQSAPRWFRDSSGVWQKKDELDFCGKCHAIYEVQGKVLVYVEKIGNNAEIHFSVKEKLDPTNLIELRDDLLKEFDLLFGWILKQNRGMRRFAEQIGFGYDGLRMLKGSSNNRILEWYCYTVK